MMVFIPFLQASHYGNGCCRRRFLHHYHLETSFQGLVCLKIFLILIKSRGTYRPKFSASQSRLEYVGRIHRSGRAACTHQSVYLIDEKNNLSLAVNNFLHNSLETFLEFSLVFRTCNQRTQIKRIYLAALEVFRHIPVNYLLRYAFRYSRLSHSGLSYQDGIVLCSSAEDLQHSADLLVTPDYGIEFSLRCPLIEIDSEPAQIFKLVFCHNCFSYSLTDVSTSLDMTMVLSAVRHE